MWRAVWSYILPYRWIIWELGWAWGVGRRTGDIDYIGRAVWTNYHVLFYVWGSRPNLAMKCGTGGIWSHFLFRPFTVLPFLIVFSHNFMLSCVTLVDILYIYPFSPNKNWIFWWKVFFFWLLYDTICFENSGRSSLFCGMCVWLSRCILMQSDLDRTREHTGLIS